MSGSDKQSRKNIPSINVTESPKSKTKKKKEPKQDKSNVEQDTTSLRRKRSKSAIDLSAFTNLTVMTLDSDYRTLGYVRSHFKCVVIINSFSPEQIRLLWEENIYWRNEASSWKKLAQHLFYHLHKISQYVLEDYNSKGI